MRAIPVIIGAMSLIVIVLIGIGIYSLWPASDAYDPNATGPAVDSGARIEIEQLRGQIENLGEKIDGLEKQLATMDARIASQAAQPQNQQHGAIDFGNGQNDIIDAYAQIVQIADRRNVNKGLRIANPTYLESVFGRPRASLSDRCQSMTNPRLSKMLVTETVGPIRVRMLQPAIDSLQRVFNKIEETDPDLYARINTAGSLCVRQIRGSRGRASTHSFGLSIDLNIDGKLDTLGDGKTQLGLTILADFFRNEGWFWGAAFSREDSMHFEVSRDKIEQWLAEGKI
ncbi:MAG: M15 family metallopeptidase [Pseudomonadota bacterium]